MTENNTYLLHACTKGLKGGNYDPIIKWLSIIRENLILFCKLIDSEHDCFDNVFGVLTCSLFSLDFKVAELGCDIIGNIL